MLKSFFFLGSGLHFMVGEASQRYKLWLTDLYQVHAQETFCLANTLSLSLYFSSDDGCFLLNIQHHIPLIHSI